MKISKKAIMRASGWSETQYKKEYAKMSGKVRNLNRLAGTHYNTSNELYYSIIEPENATVKAIQAMSSARKGTTTAMRDVAQEYIENRYHGLLRDNPLIKLQYEKIGTKQPTSTGKMRKYSLREFNAFTKRYLKQLEKERKTDPLVGSDEIFENYREFYDKFIDETNKKFYDIEDIDLDNFDFFE